MQQFYSVQAICQDFIKKLSSQEIERIPVVSILPGFEQSSGEEFYYAHEQCNLNSTIGRKKKMRLLALAQLVIYLKEGSFDLV
jgi:hypothetical protein